MANRLTQHRTVAVDVDAIDEAPRREIAWPWYAIAVLGTLAVLGAGWLLMAGATATGWLTSPDTDLEAALVLGSNFLILAHGVPVEVGGQLVSIAPLGLTIALMVLAQPVAALAARQKAGSQATTHDTGRIWVDGQAVVTRVAMTMAATQGLAVMGLALLLNAPDGGVRGLLGGVVIGGVAGLWGASRGVGFDPRRTWPSWLRSVPRAMAYAVLTCVTGGTVALVIALISHRDRIVAMHEALEPGIAGGVLLVLGQLLYLPNLMLWATSWVLGAGVTLGDDSLLSIAVTDVGFLPAFPVFGAVGEPGLGGGALFWWLAVGVVAGLVAAAVVDLARPRARFDETALVGGLSGVAAGLLVTLLCALAGGGLGRTRLAHMGATVDQLLIVAPTLLGLSGLLGGAVLGLVRRPRRAEPDGPAFSDDTVSTTDP